MPRLNVTNAYTRRAVRAAINARRAALGGPSWHKFGLAVGVSGAMLNAVARALKKIFTFAALLLLCGCVDVDASQRRADDTNAQIALDAYRAGQADARANAPPQGAIGDELTLAFVIFGLFCVVVGVAAAAKIVMNRTAGREIESLPRVVGLSDPTSVRISALEHENKMLANEINQQRNALLYLDSQQRAIVHQLEAPKSD